MMEVSIPYSPHAAQLPFHADRYRVLHRAIIAGTGSGKTEAGVFEDISWCIENPGIVGYAFEPSYPMVKRILIPKLERFLGSPIESNPLVRRFNRGDLRIDWWTGSSLWLGSLDRPESAEGGRGAAQLGPGHGDLGHPAQAQGKRPQPADWGLVDNHTRLPGECSAQVPRGPEDA